MSLSIRFRNRAGGDVSFQLASSRGTALLRQWLRPLSPKWSEFFDRGRALGTMDLSVELTKALNDSPPESADVLDTAETLLENIGHGGDDEAALLIGDDGTDATQLLGLAVGLPDVMRPPEPETDDEPPKMPNFDGIADESMSAMDRLLSQLGDAIARMKPVGEILAAIDLLVAQSTFAARMAGAAAVWSVAEPELMTFELPAPIEPRPRTRFPWLEEATKWLIDRGAYTGPQIETLAAEAQATSKQARWASVKDLETIRAEVITSFQTGESFDKFEARVKQLVQASRSQLENGFRTATHQAYLFAQTQQLEKPVTQRLFPRVVYTATLDTRVRDTHRALDHKIFEIGTEAYEIMKRVLADFQCRCSIHAINRRDLEKYPEPESIGSLPIEVLAGYG